MIYTITMNPSLDYVMFCAQASLGKLNRSKREMHLCGGKGINISIVLQNLGIENTCMGFLGGYVGREIDTRMKERGCHTDFVWLEEECTRINIKIKESNSTETEFNGAGPVIDAVLLQKLLDKLQEIKEQDYVILSGNVPRGCANTVYAQIAEIAEERKAVLLVDAEKDLLLPVLSFHPLLIKPNADELSDMLNLKIRDKFDMVFGAKTLRKMGARNVLVSNGREGAIFAGENNSVFEVKAPEGKVINTVGCGDSMVAGFLKKYRKGATLECAAKYAVACGSAGAFSENLVTEEEAEKYMQMVKVRDLSCK